VCRHGRPRTRSGTCPVAGPNDVRSYDFIDGRTKDGGALRIPHIADEYTPVAVGCRVDRSISGGDVIAELGQLFEAHSRRQVLRSDNGANLSLLRWPTGWQSKASRPP